MTKKKFHVSVASGLIRALSSPSRGGKWVDLKTGSRHMLLPRKDMIRLNTCLKGAHLADVHSVVLLLLHITPNEHEKRGVRLYKRN
jgi:hypothetical protein